MHLPLVSKHRAVHVAFDTSHTDYCLVTTSNKATHHVLSDASHMEFRTTATKFSITSVKGNFTETACTRRKKRWHSSLFGTLTSSTSPAAISDSEGPFGPPTTRASKRSQSSLSTGMTMVNLFAVEWLLCCFILDSWTCTLVHLFHGVAHPTDVWLILENQCSVTHGSKS